MAVHFDLCRKLRRKVFSRRGFVSTGDVDYNEEVTDEHRQLRGGESVFHCPFSHPSYRDVDSPFIRDVDESAPVPQPVYTPYIPKLLLGQSKRTISLKSKYVGQSYGVLPYPTVVPQIRVDATYWVSDYALSVAAETIRRMTQYMPASIFNECARKTKVGLFTKEESMTVYPEYTKLASPPGCGTSCAGTCASQCTFDGRLYSSLAGAGGQRAVVLDDNVLCNSEDPYRMKENVLVHEYAHTIKLYCLPETLKSAITSAYEQAKLYRLWTTTEYVMATEEEYWAIGTSTIFNTLHYTHGAGGMNACDQEVCSTEIESSVNLYNHDPTLYSILLKVYFDSDNTVMSGLTTCTKFM